MTDNNIKRLERGKVAAPLHPAEIALMRRTARQLNYIGIFDVPTILNIYNRRLEAAAQAMQRAA